MIARTHLKAAMGVCFLVAAILLGWLVVGMLSGFSL
jgi:hypothetical protein